MTQRRITRESEAWFALAEAFDAEPGFGILCHKLVATSFRWRLSTEVLHALLRRIALDITGATQPLWTPPAYDDDVGERAPHHQARVLACLMFGWEAKSEGR